MTNTNEKKQQQQQQKKTNDMHDFPVHTFLPSFDNANGRVSEEDC